MDISQYRKLKRDTEHASVSISIGSKVNYNYAKTIVSWIAEGKTLNAVAQTMGIVLIPTLFFIVFLSNSNVWLTILSGLLATVLVVGHGITVKRLTEGIISIALVAYVDLLKVEGYYQNSKLILENLNDDSLNGTLEDEYTSAKDNIKSFCAANKFSEDDYHVIDDFIDFCTSLSSYAQAESQVRRMQEHPEYDRLMNLVNEGSDDQWTAHELRSAQFPFIDNPDIIKDVHLERDISLEIINLKNEDIKVGGDE